MVDALRRARGWVNADGSVIDVHPTAVPAWLEIGEEPLGQLDAGDASERHARASAAVATSIDEGLFAVAATVEFAFCTYGDSLDELRNHIATHWRSTRIGDDLVEVAGARIRSHSRVGRARVVERVCLTHLRVRRR